MRNFTRTFVSIVAFLASWMALDAAVGLTILFFSMLFGATFGWVIGFSLFLTVLFTTDIFTLLFKTIPQAAADFTDRILDAVIEGLQRKPEVVAAV